jgi:hypothetical protein
LKAQIIPDDMRAPLPGPELVTIGTERPALEGTVRDPTPGADLHLPPARPAPVALIANIMSRGAKSIIRHFTQLYPDHAGDVDLVTGQPLSQRRRYGGQYSIRRLILVNVWQPEAKKVIWVPTSQEPGQWPLKEYERVSAEPEGNVEVLFDFEDQYLQFLAAHGLQGYDPLHRNDEYPTPVPGRPVVRTFAERNWQGGRVEEASAPPTGSFRVEEGQAFPQGRILDADGRPASPDSFSPPPGRVPEVNPGQY